MKAISGNPELARLGKRLSCNCAVLQSSRFASACSKMLLSLHYIETFHAKACLDGAVVQSPIFHGEEKHCDMPV